MKNTIKMSLAAAVAVSAFSTSAFAGSLEDAIKDTTISGKVEVGYNWEESQVSNSAATTNADEWEYDIDMTLNSKVNDMITAQVGFQADHAISITAGQNTDNSKTTDITLTKLNFTAKTDVATVIVGKQGQPTPFLDDERGDGIVALVPAGPVTLAAGFFTGMNFAVTDQITAAAVIGSIGSVNASLWYLTASDVVKGYSANLNGKFGPVNVDLTHTALDYEGVNNTVAAYADAEASLTKVIASMDVDAVTLTLGYGMTNDQDTHGRGRGVDLENGDHDAKVNFALDDLELDALNDADAFLIGAATSFGKTSVSALYLDGSSTASGSSLKTDFSELDLEVAYAMSKNFKVSGLYTTSTVTTSSIDTDHDTLQLSMKYKF